MLLPWPPVRGGCGRYCPWPSYIKAMDKSRDIEWGASPGEAQAGDSLYMRLIGYPVATLESVEHPFAADRRYQLLAYLACNEEWTPRELLAQLFWADHDGAMGRRNLRRLLHEARRLPFTFGLECRKDALRWHIQS